MVIKKMLRNSLAWRCAVPFLLIVCLAVCRFSPVAAESYARSVYPFLSTALSAFSSLFPFSLEEPLIVGILTWMLVFPFLKRRKGKSWKHIIAREVEVLAWVYIWFYAAWGLNYFRYSIYARAEVPPAQYEEQAFLDFLHTYTDSLNHTYTADCQPNMHIVDQEMKAFYGKVPSSYGLVSPKPFQTPKFFTFTALYSKVGVLGSMGPFFAEAQLNADLPPVQLPFTYAHEFSHLLGVSNEAEANYWAYQCCTQSSLPEVRYSGYFGILPYVLVNASMLLTEEQFREWTTTLRPEVKQDYEQKRMYWSQRYSPLLGELQNRIYDWFLKGNNISSGRKNYAEVVSILLSMPSR